MYIKFVYLPVLFCKQLSKHLNLHRYNWSLFSAAGKHNSSTTPKHCKIFGINPIVFSMFSGSRLQSKVKRHEIYAVSFSYHVFTLLFTGAARIGMSPIPFLDVLLYKYHLCKLSLTNKTLSSSWWPHSEQNEYDLPLESSVTSGSVIRIFTF